MRRGLTQRRSNDGSRPLALGAQRAGHRPARPAAKERQPPQVRIEIRRPIARALGNKASLTQCLANLIGNAIKFVAPGVTPHVQVWSEMQGDSVRLFVRDNGIRIEPDAHEKIFHIFYQLDRSYPGTGIGPAVVRKAAERMGGRIGLESTPGVGSTFHLELARAP